MVQDPGTQGSCITAATGCHSLTGQRSRASPAISHTARTHLGKAPSFGDQGLSRVLTKSLNASAFSLLIDMSVRCASSTCFFTSPSSQGTAGISVIVESVLQHSLRRSKS